MEAAPFSCAFSTEKGEKWHLEKQAKPEGEPRATWNLTAPVKLGWTLFPCLPKLDLLSFKMHEDREPETKGRCAAHHRSRERKRKNTTKSKEAAEPVWQTCCDLPTERTGSSRLSLRTNFSSCWSLLEAGAKRKKEWHDSSSRQEYCDAAGMDALLHCCKNEKNRYKSETADVSWVTFGWRCGWQRCWRRGGGAPWQSWSSSERRCPWSGVPECPGCAGTSAPKWWSRRWPAERSSSDQDTSLLQTKGEALQLLAHLLPAQLNLTASSERELHFHPGFTSFLRRNRLLQPISHLKKHIKPFKILDLIRLCDILVLVTTNFNGPLNANWHILNTSSL